MTQSELHIRTFITSGKKNGAVFKHKKYSSEHYKTGGLRKVVSQATVQHETVCGCEKNVNF